MKKKQPLFYAIICCIVLLFCSTFLIFKMYKKAEAKEAVPVSVQKHNESRESNLGPKVLIQQTTLGAIGDILIHDRVYNDAKTEAGYNFNPMLKDVHSMLKEPDLLLANQETILGGTAIGLSSYPMFNSPQVVGDALINAGVDIVSTANNHSLDKHEDGLIASLDYLDEIRLPHVGTYRDAVDQQTLRILNSNGIKVAYLSYTYGTNGMPVPEGKDYLVNLIDKSLMKDEISRAKKEADIVVMSLHWGNEYQRYPTEEQKDLGQFLVNEGVDILFGHHPHVLQPMEWVKANDGRTSLVVYSLGNFLSGQKWDYKDIGGMATVEVTKRIDSQGVHIKLANPEFFPTFVSSQNLKNYRVVPLQDAGNFGLKNAEAEFKEIKNHMTGNLIK